MKKDLISFLLFFLSIKCILQIQAQFPFIAPYESAFQLHQSNGRQYQRLPLGLNAVGPESVAFDCQGGGPYVGVSDGRILKWRGVSKGWTVFAVTSPNRPNWCDGINNSSLEQYCGRPLVLKFNKRTCELYIADSSFGLMKVKRYGGVAKSLATMAEGIPFRFLNALDIDSHTGDVYFTDSSSRYRRWEYLLIDTSDQSGRLMRYELKTGIVTVLLRGLSFANGVALSKNKNKHFLLVAETVSYRVQRYWLTGPKVGTSELFIQLTGQPDNINRNDNGDFWIAQNPTKPIKVDESGSILESLDTKEIVDASDVSEFNNTLWIGSVVQSYIVFGNF